MENQVTTVQQSSFDMTAVGQAIKQFELDQRKAKAFSLAPFVPEAYRNNVSYLLAVMDIAERLGTTVWDIVANVYFVHGNPTFGSSYMIGLVNRSGRFSPIRYNIEYDKDNNPIACTAYAYPSSYRITGDPNKDKEYCLKGTKITWDMVKKEGWANKAGSKWNSFAEQMFMYRAGAFWVRVYAPEITMGYISTEEARGMDDDNESSNKPQKKYRTKEQHQNAHTLLENMVSSNPEEKTVPEQPEFIEEPAALSNLETLFA